jgi:hypothetical protein
MARFLLHHCPVHLQHSQRGIFDSGTLLGNGQSAATLRSRSVSDVTAASKD